MRNLPRPSLLPPVLLLLLVVAGEVRGQEPARDLEAVARVRAGGWYEAPLWRRGADGRLELDYIADAGAAAVRPRFRPLLGEGLERGLMQCGALGLLALVCHGDADLLAMTAVELHFTALGVGTPDAHCGSCSPVRQHPDAQRPLAALFGANFSVKDTAAFATVELGGVTPAVVRSIAEAWFGG